LLTCAATVNLSVMRPAGPAQKLSPDDIAIARASFTRCCEAGEFFPDFYRNFFRACPEAAPLFAKTNFDRQYRLLQHAIGLLLAFSNQPHTEPTILTRVAERHSRRDLAIHPRLHGPFLESLIKTIQEHDPQFTAVTEDAWRRTIAPGFAYMQSRYE
jgi:hemoglobin-like flavoprotein